MNIGGDRFPLMALVFTSGSHLDLSFSCSLNSMIRFNLKFKIMFTSKLLFTFRFVIKLRSNFSLQYKPQVRFDNTVVSSFL